MHDVCFHFVIGRIRTVYKTNFFFFSGLVSAFHSRPRFVIRDEVLNLAEFFVISVPLYYT